MVQFSSLKCEHDFFIGPTLGMGDCRLAPPSATNLPVKKLTTCTLPNPTGTFSWTELFVPTTEYKNDYQVQSAVWFRHPPVRI